MQVADAVADTDVYVTPSTANWGAAAGLLYVHGNGFGGNPAALTLTSNVDVTITPAPTAPCSLPHSPLPSQYCRPSRFPPIPPPIPPHVPSPTPPMPPPLALHALSHGLNLLLLCPPLAPSYRRRSSPCTGSPTTGSPSGHNPSALTPALPYPPLRLPPHLGLTLALAFPLAFPTYLRPLVVFSVTLSLPALPLGLPQIPAPTLYSATC